MYSTNNRRALRWAIAVPVAIVLAGVIGLLAGTGAAHAAGLPATDCNGHAVSVPTGAGAAGAGWAVVANNSGDHPPAGSTANFTGVPLCAVQVAHGTASGAHWVYCTNAILYACGQDAMGTATPDVSATAKAELSWVLAHAADDTPTQRAVTQTHVWCVSDRDQRGRTDAQILSDAKAYFADHGGIALPAGTTCPNWSAVDPTLRSNADLNVTSDGVPAAGARTASFTVKTNLPALQVSVPGATVAVCGGSGTLSGATLNVAGTTATRDQTVRLCATGAPGSSVQVTLGSSDVLDGALTAIRSTRSASDCQVLVSAPPSTIARSAAATLTPAPAPAPVVPARPVPVPAPAPVVAPAAATVPAASVTAASVPTAHLVVAKTRVKPSGAHAHVRAGARVTWSLSVHNTGAAPAQDVRLCDDLPRGLTVVSTTHGARRSRGRICWTAHSLAAGGRIARRIVTRALAGDGAAARCQRIVNRATATATGTGTARSSSSVTVCRRRVRSGGAAG